MAETLADILIRFQRDVSRLGLGEINGVIFRDYNAADSATTALAMTGPPTAINSQMKRGGLTIVSHMLHCQFKGMRVFSAGAG